MKNLSEILDLIENFPEEEEIRRIYRYLFCRFLKEKTGLKKIDEKLKQQEIPFIKVPWEEMDQYQKQDFLDMDYFYLRNVIHTERLDNEDRKTLIQMGRDLTRENGEKAGEIIERTYKKVLAFSTDERAKIELFPSTAGEGVVEGNSLVLVLAAMPQYDTHGNLTDKETERKRVRILVALKNQLEPILSKILDMPVRILIKES